MVFGLGKKTRYKNSYKVEGDPSEVARRVIKAIESDAKSHELTWLRAEVKLEGHAKD
jgi:hypothetical protein